MAKRTYIQRGMIKDLVGQTYEPAMADFIQKLAEFGYEAITYAYKQGHAPGSAINNPIGDGKWRHRTYNLHDSFASAVYLNGVLLESTVRFISGGALSENNMGREAAWEYLRNPEVDVNSTDIALLCIAAMPYAYYLEHGKHRGGYKIKVISGASDYISARWRRLYNKWFTRRVKVIKGADYKY